MRNLSRTMIGLLVGAAMLTPIAAQAQDRGRDRGGEQRGGGQPGGWQRGGDNGAQQRGWQRSADNAAQPPRGDGGAGRTVAVNNDARREAVQPRREASRGAERPDFIAARNRQVAEQQQRADAPGNDRARALEARRDQNNTGRDWNREGNRDRDWNRDGNRGNRDRDVNRVRDGNRDNDRNRNGRNDGNRSWSTDRRDWNGNNNGRNWNRDWRNDRRYSWQDYRNHNRNVYRLPRYQARYGYGYRRWYPGYRFDAFYYASSYWISDPWFYRLPPAYGDYRWVRYYDDAVLVDIRTGEIVDIIYSIFL